MSTRESFVEHFGEDQAVAIETAAAEHSRPPSTWNVTPNKGSDEFRWAIAMTIGYECWSHEGYRSHHGITAPVEDIRQWIKDHGDMAHHDGDVDLLSLFGGIYNEYVTDPEALAEG